MSLTGALRTVAFALALTGVVDPSWTRERAVPASVRLHIVEPTDDPNVARAVERRLIQALAGDVNFAAAANPAAEVWIGDRVEHRLIPEGVPVSTIRLIPSGPNVRILSVTDPAAVPLGWKASVSAAIEAQGLAGSSTIVALEQNGVEVARTEHRWTRDLERFDAVLFYAPPIAGVARATIHARPLPQEVTPDDNLADVQLEATTRRLKVLAYEPRPSWAMTFLRRALEQDPAFEVSALVRPSRGLAVRAGSAPDSVTAERLEPFDVVLAGAPEELSRTEVDALRRFARHRGGTVVVLPDRRPSGPYLELVPARSFEERLNDTSVPVQVPAGTDLRASELVLPVEPSPGFQIRASASDGKSVRGIVVSWPLGAGRIVFSGALDAWRFRGERNDGFDRFWRAEIAAAALVAPRRLEVLVVPAVAHPGAEVVIQARLRQTEFTSGSEPDAIAIPMLSARLVGKDGAAHAVRLWPLAEPGSFEARLRAPTAGQYDVQISTPAGASADRALTVAADVTAARVSDDEGLRVVASATGGVSTTAGDLTPLARHLRSLPKGKSAQILRPTRSPWFMLSFVMILGVEWVVRRRAGWP